jgi:CheY-like chemotaxis protein
MAHLLVIDHDLNEQAPLLVALRSQRMEVTLLDTGTKAIAWTIAHAPTCILLAVELPGISGYSICNRLKNDDALKMIPLVLASHSATDATFAEHRRLKTHAQGYVHKPYVVADVLAALAIAAPTLVHADPKPTSPTPAPRIVTQWPEAPKGGAAVPHEEGEKDSPVATLERNDLPTRAQHEAVDTGAYPHHGAAKPLNEESAMANQDQNDGMAQSDEDNDPLMSTDAQLLLEGAVDTSEATQVIRLPLVGSRENAGDLIGEALADMAARTVHQPHDNRLRQLERTIQDLTTAQQMGQAAHRALEQQLQLGLADAANARAAQAATMRRALVQALAILDAANGSDPAAG